VVLDVRAIHPFLAVLVLCLVAACGEEPRTPQDTVALYLTRMGRDPMRVLPMLTDDFHRAHRMVFENTAELPWVVELKATPEAMRGDSDYQVERGRLGWLIAPSLVERVSWLFPKLDSLQLRWSGSDEEGDFARVRLEAFIPGEASADFVFTLRRRDADAPWRIDSARMVPGPPADARFACFLVAPDLDCVRFVRQGDPLRDGSSAEAASKPR